MTGIQDRDGPGQGSSPEPAPAEGRRGMSNGLVNSLTLILIGASIGVFWREIFQLTIRAIEAFR